MLNILLLVAAFSISVLGGRLPLREDGRIVGGEPANIEDVPYQVAVMVSIDGKIYHFYCGGSIISENYIVSAAHCIKSYFRYKISVGSSYTNTDNTLYKVEAITVHPEYVAKTAYNDIALMKLKSPLKLSARVAVVPLPLQGEDIPDGSASLVTGWGALNEGGSGPSQLQKVTVPTINLEMCKKAYVEINTVIETMLCAGLVDMGGKDACQGDSGGPLTINGTLMGIVSWGKGCARPEYPGIYTRVPSYVDWIHSVTKSN